MPPELFAELQEAEECFRNGEWERGDNKAASVLLRHRGWLSRKEASDLFYRRGLANRALGRHGLSDLLFKVALEENCFHIPSLLMVIALCEKKGDSESAESYRTRLAEARDEQRAPSDDPAARGRAEG